MLHHLQKFVEVKRTLYLGNPPKCGKSRSGNIVQPSSDKYAIDLNRMQAIIWDFPRESQTKLCFHAKSFLTSYRLASNSIVLSLVRTDYALCIWLEACHGASHATTALILVVFLKSKMIHLVLVLSVFIQTSFEASVQLKAVASPADIDDTPPVSGGNNLTDISGVVSFFL